MISILMEPLHVSEAWQKEYLCRYEFVKCVFLDICLLISTDVS